MLKRNWFSTIVLAVIILAVVSTFSWKAFSRVTNLNFISYNNTKVSIELAVNNIVCHKYLKTTNGHILAGNLKSNPALSNYPLLTLYKHYNRDLRKYYVQLWQKFPQKMLTLYLVDKLYITGKSTLMYGISDLAKEVSFNKYLYYLYPFFHEWNGYFILLYLLIFFFVIAFLKLGLNDEGKFVIMACSLLGVGVFFESMVIFPAYKIIYQFYFLFWLLSSSLLTWYFIIRSLKKRFLKYEVIS